ncbi:unnamed protein product [Amoebophrya sp. A25]|nr:unnamed protein product [Amoebophrya sp. A25]|eukprot:GSA25T00009216001.1
MLTLVSGSSRYLRPSVGGGGVAVGLPNTVPRYLELGVKGATIWEQLRCLPRDEVRTRLRMDDTAAEGFLNRIFKKSSSSTRTHHDETRTTKEHLHACTLFDDMFWAHADLGSIVPPKTTTRTTSSSSFKFLGSSSSISTCSSSSSSTAEFANKYVRIVSGSMGWLRPFDRVDPGYPPLLLEYDFNYQTPEWHKRRTKRAPVSYTPPQKAGKKQIQQMQDRHGRFGRVSEYWAEAGLMRDLVVPDLRDINFVLNLNLRPFDEAFLTRDQRIFSASGVGKSALEGVRQRARKLDRKLLGDDDLADDSADEDELYRPSTNFFEDHDDQDEEYDGDAFSSVSLSSSSSERLRMVRVNFAGLEPLEACEAKGRLLRWIVQNRVQDLATLSAYKGGMLTGASGPASPQQDHHSCSETSNRYRHKGPGERSAGRLFELRHMDDNEIVFQPRGAHSSSSSPVERSSRSTSTTTRSGAGPSVSSRTHVPPGVKLKI